MFCKHLLGVQKCTTNIGVLLELGRLPLIVYAQKASVKNWVRIHNSRTNNLIKFSYKGAQKDALDWLTKIKTNLAENGLGNYINEGDTLDKNLHHKYFCRLKDVFYQNSFASITNPTGKLRTYGLVKESLDSESYLKSVQNIKHRTTLSRFRLSNHKLMIEIGRHQKLPIHERICPFCPHGSIEDEIHFLIHCQLYEALRKPLFDMCIELKSNFSFYSHEEKFRFIMTCKHLCVEVARFIFRAMDLRNFLTSYFFNEHE